MTRHFWELHREWKTGEYSESGRLTIEFRGSFGDVCRLAHENYNTPVEWDGSPMSMIRTRETFTIVRVDLAPTIYEER